MPGRVSGTSEASTRKRKRKQKGGKGLVVVPPLPPELPAEDVEISDEDVAFVQKNIKHVKFLANLDTKTINRQVLGLKPHPDGSNDPDDLETYYEKRAEHSSAFVEDGKKSLSLDPVDVLPVKTLDGELHYRSTLAHKQFGEGEAISAKERRAIVRKGRTMPTAVDGDQPPKEQAEQDSRKTKSDRKKEAKDLRRKGREERIQEEQSKSKSVVLTSRKEELEDFISVHQRREHLKARMAELGTGLLREPELLLMSLKELEDMCIDRDDIVSQFAMLSTMTVFKDLLPGYRIRLPTAKELEMPVSKEVRKLRDYEAALLRFFQAFVQILVKSAKSRNRRQMSLKCLCGLLDAVPHFNYRESILGAIVTRTNSADNYCSNMCCESIKALFQNDGKHGGEATVEAVQLIADLVKLRNCHVRPEVIEVFQSLPFSEDLVRSQIALKAYDKSTQKKSKRQEKKEKKTKKRELAAQLRKQVRADFKESSLTPDLENRKKLQTLTLSAVFETYFRVLKTSLEPSKDRSMIIKESSDISGENLLGPRPLLGQCLEGLAKFSHLISVDFMGDLLGVLRTLAAGSKALTKTENARETMTLNSSDAAITVLERLQCCVVAFKIMRNNLDALNIDLREFYVQFYKLLFEPLLIRDEKKNGEALAQALQVMLCEGRQTDMQRVAAFVKRLCTLALQLGSAEAVAALLTVRNAMVRHKKCRHMLENYEGSGAVGGNSAILQAEGGDPDLSEALSCVLWELTLLSQHYNPAVANLASTTLTMINSSSMVLATLSPIEAVQAYSTHEGGFRPAVEFSCKHNSNRSRRMKVSLLSTLETELGSLANGSFKSHFREIRDFQENEALRKERLIVTRSLELFKKYKASPRVSSKRKH